MAKTGSANASILYDFFQVVDLEKFENVYSTSDYPGILVVENVVKLLRDKVNKETFVDYFSTGEGSKTENVEWYLMHINANLDDHINKRHPLANVYEWW